MPEVNRMVNELAAASGATILLTGNGADEILGAPRYIAPALFGLSRHACSRYLRDIGSISGFLLETLPLMVWALPESFRRRAYWATNWPELCSAEPPSVLGEAFRESVREWGCKWIREQVETGPTDSNWAVADAWYGLFPHEVIPSAGRVPTLSPFLREPFFGAARNVPTHWRYSADLATSYQRRKALVFELLPSITGALLLEKEIYSESFAEYQRTWPKVAPTSVQVGLVDSSALATCEDSNVLLQVRSIEHWLADAIKAGHQVTFS